MSSEASTPGANVADLIASIAPFLDEVVAADDGAGRTVYRRGRLEIARVDGRTMEVRLPEDIAEAATRTPDTAAIPGQRGWVRFTPRSSDRHVGDRAEAWFRTAWRHAGGST